MIRYIIVSFLMFLISCNEKTKDKSETAELSGAINISEADSILNLQYKFLNLYSPYIKFPLNISTTEADSIGNYENFEFTGNKIPAGLHFYLRETKWYLKGAQVDYYACYKFIIDSDTEALITRTPGAHWESKIVVFIFDKRKNKILKGLEVAETFGDAGDSFILKSTIEKLNEDFLIRITQNECHPISEDPANPVLDEYTEFECADSLKTHKLSKQDFTLIEQKRISE